MLEVKRDLNTIYEKSRSYFYRIQYVPWMEAIISCPTFIGKESLYLVPFVNNLNDYDFLKTSLIKE